MITPRIAMPSAKTHNLSDAVSGGLVMPTGSRLTVMLFRFATAKLTTTAVIKSRMTQLTNLRSIGSHAARCGALRRTRDQD